MANFGRYCILSDIHVFHLIVLQIKQTANYLNHICLFIIQ